MLPATVVYVAGADAFTRGVTEGGVPEGLIILIAGAVMLLLIAVRYSRRALEK